MEKITLRDAPVGVPLKVVEFDCGREAQCRLIGLGIIPGSRIVITNKLFEDGPFSVIVNGTKVVVGRGIINRIMVVEDSDYAYKIAVIGFEGVGKEALLKRICGDFSEVSDGDYIAPILRGSRIWRGRRILIDVLPSVLGDFPLSVRDNVGLRIALEGSYDAIVVLEKETQIERGLLLVEYLGDFGKSVVIAVDRDSDALYSLSGLSDMLGISAVAVNIRRGYGIDALFEAISERDREDGHFNLDPLVEEPVKRVIAWISEEQCSLVFPAKAVALKLLETPRDVDVFFKREDTRTKVKEIIAEAEKEFLHQHGYEISRHIFEYRKGLVLGALEDARMLKKGVANLLRPLFTVIGGLLGLYTFFLVLVFGARIGLSLLFGILEIVSENAFTPVLFSMGAVMSFFPSVFLFYLFYHLLYESGYIYRLAFSLDKLFHMFGFHGACFIPIFGSLGCPIPMLKTTWDLISGFDRFALALGMPFGNCMGSMLVFAVSLSLIFSTYLTASLLLAIFLMGVGYQLFLSLIIKRLADQPVISPPSVTQLPELRMIPLPNLLGMAAKSSLLYFRKLAIILFPMSVLVWLLNDSLNLGVYLSPASILWRPIGLGWQEFFALFTGLFAREMVLISEIILKGQDLSLRRPEVFRMLVFLFLYPACFPLYIALSRKVGRKWAIGSLAVGVVLSWVVVFVLHNLLGWI